MPQTIMIGVFALGAVLVLLAISTGGFKIFGAEMSGAEGLWTRALAGVLGCILLAVALWPVLPSLPTTGEHQFETDLGDKKKDTTGASNKVTVRKPGEGIASNVTLEPQPERILEPEEAGSIKANSTVKFDEMGALELDTNRPGNDLKKAGDQVGSADDCAALCLQEKLCDAMTYVKHPAADGGICWLKRGSPASASQPGMTSAAKLVAPGT